MNYKFPALNLYKTLLALLGYVVIGGGILLGLSIANTRQGFDIGLFFGNAIGFVVLGGSLLVVAELISVFLSIEDHLSESRSYLRTMREILQKQNQQTNR
jgi:hypothetical protein